MNKRNGSLIFIFALALTACGGSSSSSKENRAGSVVTTDFAKSASCVHRIVFVPQIHASIMNGKLQVDEEWKSLTVNSQFRIAQFLQRNSTIPIFSEQVDTDITLKTAKPEFIAVTRQVRATTFPNGLPASEAALNLEQQKILALAGGDAVSLMLGNIPKLFKVVENQRVAEALIGRVTEWARQNPTFSEYPTEISDIIFRQRELLALEQINRFFAKHPRTRDVILIYGQAHDFTVHPKAFASECVVRAEGF